ncbi:tetratricopeptide repeat protein [Hansschlegelia quercus]|uniref:Tetratricopeptide repeat protein n=1 Tax=Hansschlegelia quercus TaxID=2528245 RepID=A0A4Q9GR81_9HYPH|nr:tetratricopeptide repeat protein [Hansschlegelia quercus]TBN54247.1 tetratricopeptide repeat protein [Hansschlegelia quercus]
MAIIETSRRGVSREITINIVVGLVVAIVSGIIIWAATREDGWFSGKEKLTYRANYIEGFQSISKRYGFLEVVLRNSGRKTSPTSRIFIKFSDGTTIIERKANLSSGLPVTETDDKSKGAVIDFVAPILAAGEEFTTSILFEGAQSVRPEIVVKNDNGLAEENNSKENKSISMLTIVPIVMALVCVILTYIFLANVVRKKLFVQQSLNNTAFLFLQKKMVNEAVDLLRNELLRSGFSQYELANYALALGLSGDHSSSERMFQLAEWWAFKGHAKAVVLYNKATLMIAQGNAEDARPLVTAALRISRRPILEYMEISDYMKDAGFKEADF